MKQFLKLAALNLALVEAQRKHSAAQVTKNSFDIENAKCSLDARQEELDNHLSSKRMENEFNKYESRKDEVKVALIEAGYDTAVMDFF
jgi:hypothetical protein